MTEMNLYLDRSDVAGMFNSILQKLEHPTEALEIIGRLGANAVRKNFDEGGRYSSPYSAIGGDKKWLPHSPATKRIYESKGIRGPYALLVQSGRLVQSITSRVEGSSVVVGTNMEYAAIQQYGAKAGQYEMLIKAHVRKRRVMASQMLKNGKFGKLKPMTTKTSVRAHMRKSPAIPARPFMNIHPDSLDEIIRIVTNEFLKDVNKS